MRVRQLILLLAALTVLASCNLDALPDGGPGPNGGRLPGQPTPAAIAPLKVDTTLAGRLLFVVQGNLWLWQRGTTQQLTTDGRWFHATWSPDGGRIACVLRENGASDLFILDAEGQQPQRLTANNSRQPAESYERIYEVVWALYPAWSPDGASIVYASQYGPPIGSPAADYNLALYSIPAYGGERRQLVADETAHVGRASYDPRGGQIALARFPTGGDASPQIYRYREDADIEPFPGLPQASYDPAFSPDGRFLAFAARTDDTTDVFVIEVGAGKPAQQITSHGRARAPVFAPDGQALAYLADGPDGFQLWVVPFDATATPPRVGEPEQLTAGPSIDVDSGVSWAP